MNAWNKVVEITVTTVLLFIAPIYFMSCKVECMEQNFIQNEAVYFVDSIRNTGFVTKQMYETFERRLSIMKNHYDIELKTYERWKKEGVGNSGFIMHSKDEILKELYSGEEKIAWKQGDYVSIRIVGKAHGLGVAMFRFFTKRNMELPGTYVTYGGVVRDDIF